MRPSSLKASLMSRTRRRSRALLAILRSFSRSAFCSGVRSSSSLLLGDKRDATFSNGVGKKEISKLVLFSSRVFRGCVHLPLSSWAGFYIHLNLGRLQMAVTIHTWDIQFLPDIQPKQNQRGESEGPQCVLADVRGGEKGANTFINEATLCKATINLAWRLLCVATKPSVLDRLKVCVLLFLTFILGHLEPEENKCLRKDPDRSE